MGAYKGRVMVFSKSVTLDEDDLGHTAIAAHSAFGQGAENARFIDKLKEGDADAFGTLIDRYSGVFASL